MNRQLNRYAIAAALTLALSATAGFAQRPDPGMKIDPANTALVGAETVQQFVRESRSETGQ